MHARMFYSTVAAAERLSLSPRTLELYRRTGEGPAFRRCGSRVRYLDEDIEEWAAARRRESMARERGERRETAGGDGASRRGALHSEAAPAPRHPVDRPVRGPEAGPPSYQPAVCLDEGARAGGS